MSIEMLQQAKSDAVAARARFLDTLDEARSRLKPGNLANEAWTGVKDKTAEAAGNAVDAVKQRPRTVALVLGGLALFLARKPIGRAATKVVSRRKRKGNRDGD
ncbi:MAG TPA: hypothetical protein VEC11_13670 [Allosphingosinicella sp.]|nr:hypothetical protein [Allosphingosinicella sp.]